MTRWPLTDREFDRLSEHDPLRDECERGCHTCDGTGCPCLRTRDWQSIELGCARGCPECGRRSCRERAA